MASVKGLVKRIRTVNTYCRLRRRGRRRKADVFIDMDSVCLTRRLDQIIKIMGFLDFKIRVKLSFRQYAAMNRYGRRLFDQPGVTIGDKTDGKALLVTDCVEGERKRLLVRYDIYGGTSYGSNDLVLPIMMHPDLLNRETYGRLPVLRREASRDMNIFFAGNFAQKSYSRPISCGEKVIPGRYDLIEAVRRHGLEGKLEEPDSYDEFTNRLNAGDYRDSFVLIDISRFSLPREEWLSILSRTEFFFAPPGYRQPFCHNIVEAMAVGAVPIAPYGEFFHPPLIDGEQIFRYDGVADLPGVLSRILRDEGTPETMRKKAISYHDDYLSLDFAGSKVKDFIESENARLNLYLAGGEA